MFAAFGPTRAMYLPPILLFLSPVLGQVVDLTTPPAHFRHFWKRCVGSGHMLLGTRSDWQQHLIKARDELGFVGVRGHGLLDDDMSVMPKKGEYEFFNVDTVYDFLISNKIRPVVELSFMPMALVNCPPQNCSWAFNNHGAYKGLRMPPNNFSEWEELIRVLATHFVDRYGLDEVATWDFEVWNELWGVDFPHPYMALYASSAKALKSVSPKLRVGGPATMQVLHVKDFVDAVHAQNLPMDFVSTHLYPTDPECPSAKHATGLGDVDCFTRLIHGARDYVREHAANVEFLITEYNAGLGLPADLDLDAPFGAAFAFRQIAAIQDVDMFSWWTFTDIFEEQWMKSKPFQNGFGLQTIHGVPKPAWRAFQLLKDAGSWRAPVTGASPEALNTSLSVLATLDAARDAQELQLFVADWSPADATRYSCDASSGTCKKDVMGSYTDQALCDAQCGSGLGGASNTVKITLKHHGKGLLNGGDVTATLARIDTTHGYAKARWQSMGSPGYLNKAQIDELMRASQLTEEATAVERVDEQTSMVSFELPPWSAVRVRVSTKAAYVV
mmetsp:Transcript_172967/g.420741  ORF Transcript_172967/g.420741 Transcript_172967/m.420741 type:complete len:557 (-) Transcript_172967:11-1681(-)